MLSITMMELSTIIPTPRINPDKDMMLREMPNNLNANSVMSKDNGMDNATNIAKRHLRIKNNKTNKVKKAAAKRFHSKLLIE